MAAAPREVAPRPAVTRLALGLCLLAVLLAVAAIALATFNGLNLLDLIADHHAIGIMDALVLAPIGALIVVGDRRHLLAWLLLVDGLILGALNFAQQYAPLALGLTPRRLSLPGGELASWLASWAFVPGIVIGVVFLPLLFPDGRLPSRRWWPLGLAGVVAIVVPTAVLAAGTWPLRGPELVPQDGQDPELVTAVFGITLPVALLLGAVSVVALVMRGGPAAGRAGHRHLPLPAVGHRPAGQPDPGLRAAHRPARRRLRRAGPCPWPAVRRDRRADAELGGGRGDPGRGRPVPAGPPPRPAGGRPALQPA
jgi:hypothetical protein